MIAIRKTLIRPPDFRLDPDHYFSQGSMAAYLGQWPGSSQMVDSLGPSGMGPGNHGTLTNMDPLTDWVFDPYLGRRAVDLVGTSSQFITLGRPAAFDYLATDSFTHSIWMYNRNTSQVGVWGRYLNGGTGWAMVPLSNGKLDFFVASVGSAEPTADYTWLNKWVHLAMVLDRATQLLSIWANGVFLASASTATVGAMAAAIDVTLGRYATSGYYFTGMLSDPLSFRRALSAAEIACLADPSNAMLSGWIQENRRRTYFVPAAAAGGNRRRRILTSGAA